MLKKLFEKSREQDAEIVELVKEIRNCEFLMARNDTFFNMTSDEDLIESQIYEREALRSQYNYLIKQLRDKEQCLSATAHTVKTGE